MAEKKPSEVLWVIGFVLLILLGILNKLGIVTFNSDHATTTPRANVVHTQNVNNNNNVSSEDRYAEEETVRAGESVWSGKIRISAGGAASQYQTYKEYITVRAGNLKENEKVNITGWTLTNSRGMYPYLQSDKVVFYPSNSIIIPGAARILSISGNNILSPVILERGGSAILVTGEMQNSSQFKVTSFLINKCSGYLENLPTYDFVPKLSANRCPRPQDEIVLRGLEKSCRELIEGMSSCKTPTFPDSIIVYGERQTECVNETCNLSTSCRTIIKNTLSYNACVARHAQDADFYTKEWRVYLGQKWELWGKEDETINLFDNEGKVVDSISW